MRIGFSIQRFRLYCEEKMSAAHMTAVGSCITCTSRKVFLSNGRWNLLGNTAPGTGSEADQSRVNFRLHEGNYYLSKIGRMSSSRKACARPANSSQLFAVPHGFSTAEEEEGRWERVQLLERQLEVAVSEENYRDAMRLQDQLTRLKCTLTPSEQFLLLNVDRLQKGTVDEQLEAVDALGELGDKRVLSMLIHGLLDTNLTMISRTEKAMWKIFMRSGDPEIDKLLQKGVNMMNSKENFPAARDIFSEVIGRAPSFAEGYNKRATVHYLLKDYEKSIEDCKTTLELNPYHFAARSGLGLCYAGIKDYESAIYWFEQAYAMHPGLSQIKRCIDTLKQVGDNDKTM